MREATTTESQRRRPFGAAWCLAVLLLVGCRQDRHCPDLGNCGGDLFGEWTLRPANPERGQAEHGSCSEDLYIPPTDKRLVGGDVPAARVPAPEPAFSDWCRGLIAAREDIFYDTPLFYTESAPVGVATLRYAPGGTYDGGFGLVGTYTFEFSAACMRQFGAYDGRPPPDNEGLYDPNSTDPPVDICKQLEVPLAASGVGEGAYRNTTCIPNPNEPRGCLCYFDRAEVFGIAGRWALIASNEILHTPTSAPNFPHRAIYCRTGDTLELTGSDGAYLLGYPGLRTMKMARSTCTDGIRNQDEEDIDCGGVTAQCPPCVPTCTDGMQNGDETGPDCGGSCPTPCPP